jgi:hypothetical protein
MATQPKRTGNRAAAAWRSPALLALRVACGLTLASGAFPALAAEDIMWHSYIEDARTAAAKSGKPIYAFIFVARSTACMRMRFETFKNPKVVELLAGFECCAVDAGEPGNKAFVDKYAAAVSQDPVHKTKFGMMPASLFTRPDGAEHYIRWGYIESDSFAVMLLSVFRLVELKQSLAAKPDDARANADIGQVMLDLDMQTNPVALPRVKQYLQRAIDLDPGNKLGALEDALLNLRILQVPDDPAKGYELLGQFLKDFPNTRHRPRVIFYQAAALCGEAGAASDRNDEKTAKAKYQQAFEALKPFKTPKEDTTSIWATSACARQALELEKQIGVYLGVYPNL